MFIPQYLLYTRIEYVDPPGSSIWLADIATRTTFETFDLSVNGQDYHDDEDAPVNSCERQRLTQSLLSLLTHAKGP